MQRRWPLPATVRHDCGACRHQHQRELDQPGAHETSDFLFDIFADVCDNVSELCALRNRRPETLAPDDAYNAWYGPVERALRPAAAVARPGDVPMNTATGGGQQHGETNLGYSGSGHGEKPRPKRPREDTPGRDGSGGRKDGRGGDGGRGGGGGPARRKSRGGGPGDPEQQLACPFWKYDLAQYWSCLQRTIRHPSDVREHLKRYHRLDAHSNCPRCGEHFDGDASEHERFVHVRQEPQCDEIDFPVTGVTRKQRAEIADAAKAGIHRTEPELCWFFIWRVIFPHITPPLSPFVDPEGLIESMRHRVRNGIPDLNDVTDLVMETSTRAQSFPRNDVLHIIQVAFRALASVVDPAPAEQDPEPEREPQPEPEFEPPPVEADVQSLSPAGWQLHGSPPPGPGSSLWITDTSERTEDIARDTFIDASTPLGPAPPLRRGRESRRGAGIPRTAPGVPLPFEPTTFGTATLAPGPGPPAGGSNHHWNTEFYFQHTTNNDQTQYRTDEGSNYWGGDAGATTGSGFDFFNVNAGGSTMSLEARPEVDLLDDEYLDPRPEGGFSDDPAY